MPLVFAAPAHADSISIDLDATAVTLQRSGDLYEHTSSLHVHNSNTYGFTLSMNASQPNLVNSKDSTYKIDSVSGTNKKLAANQWGYGIGKNATTFSSVSSASLADITSDNKGSCSAVDDCTLYLTLGADIDPKRLPTGSYSTNLTYTATSKPAPAQPSTPSGGGSSSGGSSSGGSSSGGSSSGGSSYDYWWSVCYDKYSGSDELSYQKRSYCKNNYGDMSGFQPDWDAICRERYSDNSDKKSYCVSHDGDMSGYREPESEPEPEPKPKPDCIGSYYDDPDKESYCIAHNGDMSGYRNVLYICDDKYPGTDSTILNKFNYCMAHNGDMSGYQEPEPEP